jgi:hypothetical protein
MEWGKYEADACSDAMSIRHGGDTLFGTPNKGTTNKGITMLCLQVVTRRMIAISTTIVLLAALNSSSVAAACAGDPLEPTPFELRFASVKVNTEARKVVKLKANEDVNIKVVKIPVTEFKIVSNNCSSKKLEAAHECEVEVGFLPKAMSHFSGSLEVPFEVISTKGETTLLVLLTGDGV